MCAKLMHFSRHSFTTIWNYISCSPLFLLKRVGVFYMDGCLKNSRFRLGRWFRMPGKNNIRIWLCRRLRWWWWCRVNLCRMWKGYRMPWAINRKISGDLSLVYHINCVPKAHNFDGTSEAHLLKLWFNTTPVFLWQGFQF